MSQEENSNNEDKLAGATKEQLLEMVKGFKEMMTVSSVRDRISGGNKIERKIDKGGYFNEKEARGMIPILDGIAEDKQTREFRYDDYPFWAPNTIWAKINQSIKYLVEVLDVEGKYNDIRHCIRISKGDTGVLLQWVNNPILQQGGWIVHKTADTPTVVIENYKTRVLKFMEESNPEDMLDIKENLNLTPDEIQYFKGLFEASPVFMAYVSTNRIKIVHTKEKSDE